MAGALASSFPAEAVTLFLAGVLLALVALAGYRAWKSSRVTPAERERLRRGALAARGKLGDASLVEVRGEMVFYSYAIRGVEYTASQDVSSLHEYLPTNDELSGPVWVRYDPRNPANSIVLAESWTGLRSRSQSTTHQGS
jgi:hypothetical protein